MGLRIVIAGGGIVGLTSALAFAAAGLRASVFEAVPELRPLGVGINLLPHAMRELNALGLQDEIARLGVPIDSQAYHMQDGREVWTEPRGLAAGYDWPQIAVHRGRLHMFLLEKVREILGHDAVRTGMTMQSFRQDGDAVSVLFADRDGAVAAVDADVLIAADGIHSVARRSFYPNDGRPIWNGVTLFRATTRMPIEKFGRSMLWAGYADQKFIAYPIEIDAARGEMVLNWVCDLRTAEPGSIPSEDWNTAVSTAHLIERYRDWQWGDVDVPAIIGGADVAYGFPMIDRDPLPQWSFGRVTLAGDAAHPMYPIGSNGATQGIIDARAAAYALATAADPISALRNYEELRRERTSRIVLGNRAQGPDVILDIARRRAPDASVDLAIALPHDERQEIAAGYKRLAGFDPASLKQERSFTVSDTAESVSL